MEMIQYIQMINHDNKHNINFRNISINEFIYFEK